MLQELTLGKSKTLGNKYLDIDLNHQVLVTITPRWFKKPYLSRVEPVTLTQPLAEGIRFGKNDKILMCLPLKYKDRDPVWCTFIVDTGSPINYLSDETLKTLGIDHLSSSVRIRINDVVTEAYSSDTEPNLSGVNLVGNSFLNAANHCLTLSYLDGECTAKLEKV
jgi:hypothetical protein